MGSSNAALQQLAPSRLFRYFEAGSLIACVGLLVWLAVELSIGVTAMRPAWWALVAAACLAYMSADFIAGFVHFAGDTFGSVDTPWLGLTFVLPFRAHHLDPQDICRHDLIATNGNNAFATLFVLIPALALLPMRHSGWAIVAGVFVWVLSALLLMTNQIHKWAHVARPPRLVGVLQRAGLLISSTRHLSHHRPPYVGGYCVTSGLCNRLLDPIGFFPFVERALRVVLMLPVRQHVLRDPNAEDESVVTPNAEDDSRVSSNVEGDSRVSSNVEDDSRVRASAR